MKTLNTLAIGNSFTEDSTRYLYQLSNAAGIPTKVVNLYIGGCSLERHWKNIETNQAAYNYQLNGLITERTVSIEEVLTEETWDYIITQQASPDSGWFDSYEPFLGLMLQHIKEKAPTAKILLQETWSYELGSSHPYFIRYNRNQQEMYDRLHTCYTKMADKYNLDLIPSGTIIQKVRSLPEFYVPAGGLSLCRDGYHMSFDYGRYLLACIWLKKLTGISLKDNGYIPDSAALKRTPDTALLKLLRDNVESYL